MVIPERNPTKLQTSVWELNKVFSYEMRLNPVVRNFQLTRNQPETKVEKKRKKKEKKEKKKVTRNQPEFEKLLKFEKKKKNFFL